ncbi:hypothetical protein DO70_3193 [Burkholderia pseudomallei]|nr:hypothetical protein DO70_3193 [Burkholderia pseudomallei]
MSVPRPMWKKTESQGTVRMPPSPLSRNMWILRVLRLNRIG